MTLFHVLAGVGLIGLTVYACVLPFINDDFSGDRMKFTTMLVALGLGFVLFTGFLQLGSRHSVPQTLIYKLGATAAGGAIALLGLFLRMKQLLKTELYLFVMAVGFCLFSVSLYWGLTL